MDKSERFTKDLLKNTQHFPTSVFLHIMDRLRTIAPIIVPENVKFDPRGNNVAVIVMHTKEKEEWKLTLMLTKKL